MEERHGQVQSCAAAGGAGDVPASAGESVDLSIYKDNGDDNWYMEEQERVGIDRLRKQYAYLYNLADHLRRGESIDLIKICSDPQNRRIAVKICCEICNMRRFGWRHRLEQLLADKPTATLAERNATLGKQYAFNKTYTRFIRIN